MAVSTIVPIGMSERRRVRAGRIRTGEQVKSRNGKWIPTTLDHFRFTSSHPELLEPLAAEYGGTIEEWGNRKSGDRYKVDSTAQRIEVILPPNPLHECYELWDPDLKRRCNGIVCDALVGSPDGADREEMDCLCVRRGVLECSYKLRLGVLIDVVQSLGVWQLHSGSDNARKEMPEVVETIEGLQGLGYFYAVLRLEQRRGGNNKPFWVPVLDVGASIGELMAGAKRVGQLPVAPRIAPVGELGAAAGEGVPSSSPAATSDDEPDRDMADHLYGQGTFQSAADDEVVDAEIVEEIAAASPHADLEPDNLMYAREFFARVKDGPTKERNRWMRRVREIAQANGEPIPANWDAVPGHILNQLASEADL